MSWTKIKQEVELTDKKANFTNSSLGKFAFKEYVPMTYLYNEGNECSSITGGWSDKYRRDTHYYYSSGASGTVTKGENTLSVFSGGLRSSTATRCNNLIDVTDYTALKVEVTAYTQAAQFGGAGVVIDTEPSNDESRTEIGGVGITGAGTYSIDLSGITGSYYIILHAINSTTWGSAGNTVEISKMWLE